MELGHKGARSFFFFFEVYKIRTQTFQKKLKKYHDMGNVALSENYRNEIHCVFLPSKNENHTERQS
jgi:hypothetical protein